MGGEKFHGLNARLMADLGSFYNTHRITKPDKRKNELSLEHTTECQFKVIDKVI